MDKTIMIFSGRNFTSEDIDLIKWTRKRYPQLSRTELARTFCEFLGWTTPAGKAKTPQCMSFLKKLEEEGLIKLPALDVSKVWKRYISDYHMLGNKQVFGAQLAYFIKSKETILGCLQFSASSWALSPRDQWIGWNVQDRKQRLHLIVNNSRYLIFPWVNVKNLASKVLSIAIKQLQEDWLREYCYAPVLLESFVDTSHFAGTCYKASNWLYLGETQGRGRMDTKREYSLSRKAIFMYPLQKDFKDCLKGIKPCKVVNPDD